MARFTLPLLAGMLFTAPLFAAQPLATDDTGTVGKNAFQFELGTEFLSDEEKEGGVTFRETGGEVGGALTWGLSDRIDLVAALPLLWYKQKEDGDVVADEEGIGDLSLELKWRFYEASDTGEGFSLAIKPGLTLPTGDENKGLGNGEVSGGIQLLATHRGALGAIHANAGYTRNEYRLDADEKAARKDIWNASLAGEINVTSSLLAVCELGTGTNGDRESSEHPLFLTGGLILNVMENLDIDAGVRAGLNDAETDTAILAGLTARF